MLNENFRANQLSNLNEAKDKTMTLEKILNKEVIDFRDIVEIITLEGKIVSSLQTIADEILEVSM